MRKHSFSLVKVAIPVALLLPRVAAAQDDPPSRVARLAYVTGSVGFQPAGTEDWIDATPNRPLTTGDQLWSDYGSRAAIHTNSASISLSEKTGFTFLNLDDDTVQIQLKSGTVRIRLKRLDDDENFEIDTPNLAFSILRPGVYKITVNEAGDTTVIEDRHGAGEVTGGGSAYALHHGDIGTFYGTERLSADVETLSGDGDDFERWCEQRDHHEDASVSARYVSDDAIGYEDLDDYGGWRPVPEYGMVWFPTAASAGWAPYHDGHWSYVAPWGYTWVDNAPWGFAPFHYGRWINIGGSWGWIPCPPRPPHITPEYVRPVYAPALVAWVGGPHFGVGLSVGWFPLGPREVYVPSYPVSRAYVNRVNVSNTTVNTTVVNNYYTTVVVNKTVNVTNVTYVNQRVPGAVVATTPQAFSSGQPVAKNTVRVDVHEVASAPVAALTPPAVPQRAAVLEGRSASNVHPPAAIQARAVVVKTAPPPPPPTFVKRQAAIQSNGGRPLSMAEARQIAPLRTQSMVAPQIKMAPPAGKPVEPRAAQPPPTPPGVQNNPPHPVQTPLSGPNNSTKPANVPASSPVANGPVKAVDPHAAQAQTPPVANVPVKPIPVPPSNTNPPHPARPVTQDNRMEQQREIEQQQRAQQQQLAQQHQQEATNLQHQQDQQRQRLQQQQQKEAEQLQKQKADATKIQAVQQQHQQQLQQLAQKHQQEQHELQQKHEEQRRAQVQQQAKPRDEKDPK